MKSFFFTVCLLVPAALIAAAEVVFVPGWFSRNNTDNYKTALQKVFPGKRITVLSWESNQRNWNNAVRNAEAFVPEVVKYIAGKTPEERAELTLIGHSLGGRIIIRSAGDLAGRKLKINRFILLGTAEDFDVDLSSIPAVSNGGNINIFSRNDSVLRFLYSNAARKLALGYCGAEKLPSEFTQYSFATSGSGMENSRLSSALIEFNNHFFTKYIDELTAVLAGERKPYSPEYDYSGVQDEYDVSFMKDIVFPPVPQIEVFDSFANWTLCGINIKISRKNEEGEQKEYSKMVYFIFDHYGRVVKCHLIKFMIQRDFNRIKKKIVKCR